MANDSVQRRLAAILAADVVGYSRLIERDDAGTLAALKQRRTMVFDPLVEAHRGRIFKSTGDGVLIEFASAVSALQCAIELQQAMAASNAGQPDERHVVLRIGVNLGEVMIDGDDLYGEGINIAARLEAKAGPGEIYVSEDAFRQVRGKLPVDLEDLGELGLKNISFPIRTYRLRGAVAARATTHATAEKPSIVVLPFSLMSEVAGRQYLSDGVTEDIITELSRYNSLLVIARNSAFQFRGDNIDIAAVRRKLGVAYVLEGSVRTSANRLRITAQLIDAASEAHIWADRFDRGLEDIFDIQDEIARTVAATVEGRVSAAGIEQLRRKPTADWVAYDYFLQGRDLVNRSRMAEGERMLAEAVKLDPTYAHAHAFRAIALAGDYWAYRDPERLDQALACAQRALALDDDDAWCHQAMGYVQLERHRLDLAGPHFERAIRLNANDTGIAGERANWLVYAGRAEEAVESIDHAMQRDPHPPSWVWGVRGHALFHIGRYQEAIESFGKRADDSNWARMQLAATYAGAGQIEAAGREIARILENDPDASISHFKQAMCYSKIDDETRMIAALRRAGLPD